MLFRLQTESLLEIGIIDWDKELKDLRHGSDSFGLQRKQAVLDLFREQPLLCYHLVEELADNIDRLRQDQAMSQDALGSYALRRVYRAWVNAAVKEQTSMWNLPDTRTGSI